MAGIGFMLSNWVWTLAAALGLWIIYGVALAIYRVYISPLSRFPGPKLAAATLWYEFYYDVVKRGQYTWKIRDLHTLYGPIIRINPFEIHIDDPDYYNELYTGPSKKRDKWAWSAGMFGISSGFFSSIPHDLHRRRRAPLNPFFSKASIRKVEPMMRKKIEKLCTRLEGFRESKESVNLRHAFAAVTMDIIAEYAFGTSYDCLDEADFAPIWSDSVDALSEQSHMNKQMPWILALMRMTPLWLVERLDKNVMHLIKFQMKMATEVVKQMKGDRKAAEHTTVFEALLEPGALPPEERTVSHLVDEAQAVVAAGQVTTTFYLNTTCYHIIANPCIHAKLKAQLKTVFPDGSLPSCQFLEQLPYLTAVILEGYRISYGVTHRLQRVSPNEDLIYQGYRIPAGTPVSMTSVLIHDNPELFPEPHVFKPDRWLEPNARQKLSNYLVNFSRGTRGCLGQELAQAEIYLVLAAIFSRFDFELYKTTREDIDVAHDFFNPQPKKGSVGLRVIVN